MTTTPKDPLSHARILTEATREAQERADSFRIVRDQAIREAVSSGISQRRVASVLGLSATVVRTIVNQEEGDE